MIGSTSALSINFATGKIRIRKVVSKFHDGPTVNESGIVVLLGHVWVYVGKVKAQCEGHFFHHRYYVKNPNDRFV